MKKKIQSAPRYQHSITLSEETEERLEEVRVRKNIGITEIFLIGLKKAEK